MRCRKSLFARNPCAHGGDMTRGLTRVNLTQRRIGLRTLGSGGRLCFLGDVRFGSGSQLGGNWRVDDRVAAPGAARSGTGAGDCKAVPGMIVSRGNAAASPGWPRPVTARPLPDLAHWPARGRARQASTRRYGRCVRTPDPPPMRATHWPLSAAFRALAAIAAACHPESGSEDFQWPRRIR